MSPKTIPTSIMIISDTHEHSLDGADMPSADILLHTGDLTNFGELESLKESVRMMGTISAELKLVIAGNHDISVDPTRRIENMTDIEYSEYHRSALDIMTGPLAKAARITYLEEGTHSFTLKSGAKFTVYASPYTPGSGGWAFPYQLSEDRYNTQEQCAANQISTGPHPMPSKIDIVMTHGPPRTILDQVDGQHLGCPNLLRALGRVRPLLHCFGHIHEGYGAHIVNWKSNGEVANPSAATPMETEQINEYPYPCEWDISQGKQTLMVNAAIMRNTSNGMRPDLQPFIVLLNLHRQ